MKHMHKIVLAAVVLALLSFASSCAVTAENTTPEQATELQQHEADIAAAKASGGAAALTAAEARLRAFEQRVIRERAGPIVAGLSAMHPLAAAVSPLFLAALPLFGRRGRKHAATVVDSLNPFSKAGPSTTEKGVNLGRALDASLAYLGIKHSSPESEAAANKPMVAPEAST